MPQYFVFLTVIVGGLFLSGCAGMQYTGLTEAEQEQVTPRMVYAHERERLNGYLESINDYAQLPRCSATLNPPLPAERNMSVRPSPLASSRVMSSAKGSST